jgi:ribosomal protein L11 methyltransferase
VLSVRPSDPESREVLADVMIGMGGRAVVEEEGRLVTHLPGPDEPTTAVAELVRTLRDAFGPRELDIRTGWQRQEEWADVWRRGLAPRRITERIVVTPSWCQPEVEPGDLVIVVDPGMAFGTAEHATTRGCLRLLERAVRAGDRVADVGAGSGILSIAAALLGATDVLALEGDPWAIDAANENIEANGAGGVARVTEVWADAETLPQRLGPREGIVANIEHGVLQRLLPGFRRALTEGAWLVLGGVLDHEWPEMVRKARDTGFALEKADQDEEWRAGLFRRVESSSGPASGSGPRASGDV